MAEKIEDLNLPNSNVVRIIKEALPEGVSVGKDARAALARAASVFIIHLTAIATSEARKDNHKSVKVQDILAALEEAEFDSFVEPLKETLESKFSSFLSFRLNS